MSKHHRKQNKGGQPEAAAPIPTGASRDRTASKLYLAYGSNLNIAAMRHRCPDAIPIGKSSIRNMRLIFRHVADITDAPDMKVPVGVWRISPRDERALDMYEGVKAKLYRKITVRIDGEPALSYRMNDRGIMVPSESYLDTIRRGYKDFELDEAALTEALDHAVAMHAPTDATWERFQKRRARELAAARASWQLDDEDGESGDEPPQQLILPTPPAPEAISPRQAKQIKAAYERARERHGVRDAIKFVARFAEVSTTAVRHALGFTSPIEIETTTTENDNG